MLPHQSGLKVIDKCCKDSLGLSKFSSPQVAVPVENINSHQFLGLLGENGLEESLLVTEQFLLIVDLGNVRRIKDVMGVMVESICHKDPLSSFPLLFVLELHVIAY